MWWKLLLALALCACTATSKEALGDSRRVSAPGAGASRAQEAGTEAPNPAPGTRARQESGFQEVPEFGGNASVGTTL